MFYRYTTRSLRVPVDFDDLYEGKACFLAGGSPALKDQPLELLQQPGVSVMAMNNTASIIRPDFWVGGDRPQCYSSRILLDPRPMKFAIIISRREEVLTGTNIHWRQCPNTYFFGTTDAIRIVNFLDPHRDYVWWKNTFYIALQILYRLGFRKIYLIGCSFKINNSFQYAYDAKLDDGEVTWNQRTYNSAVANMKHMRGLFLKHGVEIISSTPESTLNEWYPYIPFEAAIADSLKTIPELYLTEKCPHSSVFAKEREQQAKGA